MSSLPSFCEGTKFFIDKGSSQGHLLFTRGQNFRLVQIESISRRHHKCDSKIEICFGRDRKHCGKGRKMLVTGISSFSHKIFKSFLPQGRSKSGLCGKKLIENIVGKRENAGYQHFSFSHNVFKKFSSTGSQSQDCVVKS